MTPLTNLVKFNDALASLPAQEVSAHLLANEHFLRSLPEQLNTIGYEDSVPFTGAVRRLLQYIATAISLPHDKENELKVLHSTLLEAFFEKFELPPDSDEFIPGVHQNLMWLELYVNAQSLDIIQKNKNRFAQIVATHSEHPNSLQVMKSVLHLMHRIVISPHPKIYEDLFTQLKLIKRQAPGSLNLILISNYESLYELKQSTEALDSLLDNIRKIPKLFEHINKQVNHIQTIAESNDSINDITAEKIILLLQTSSQKDELKLHMHQHALLFLLACVVEQPSNQLASPVETTLSLLQDFSKNLKPILWKMQPGDDFSEYAKNMIEYCLTMLECLVLIPSQDRHPHIYIFRYNEIKTLIVIINDILEKDTSRRERVDLLKDRLDKVQEVIKDAFATDIAGVKRMLLIEQEINRIENPKQTIPSKQYTLLNDTVRIFSNQYPQILCTTQWTLRIEQAQQKKSPIEYRNRDACTLS